jgi:hypothetical protein
MKDKLNQIRLFVSDITRTAKVRKRLLAIAAVFVVLQLYFVRELIAAELLFGLGFAVLFFLAAVFYVVGAIGERAIDVTKVGAHVVADSAHRGYVKAAPVLEVAAKRSAVLAEVAAKVLAHLARLGCHELGVASERALVAIQVAARAVVDWARREYARALPVLEVTSKRIAVLAEAGSKAVAHSARQGYHKLEEISKKPFRHPRSESAR